MAEAIYKEREKIISAPSPSGVKMVFISITTLEGNHIENFVVTFNRKDLQGEIRRSANVRPD